MRTPGAYMVGRGLDLLAAATAAGAIFCGIRLVFWDSHTGFGETAFLLLLVVTVFLRFLLLRLVPYELKDAGTAISLVCLFLCLISAIYAGVQFTGIGLGPYRRVGSLSSSELALYSFFLVSCPAFLLGAAIYKFTREDHHE